MRHEAKRRHKLEDAKLTPEGAKEAKERRKMMREEAAGEEGRT